MPAPRCYFHSVPQYRWCSPKQSPKHPRNPRLGQPCLLAASPALLNVPILRAIPICIVGNILPIPFILLLIRHVLEWMKKVPCFRGIALWLERKAMSKKGQIEKYEFWGLMLFVGIPLPGTGAWTGALVASLLHMKFGKAFGAILVGIALATVIMSILSYGVLGVLFG